MECNQEFGQTDSGRWGRTRQARGLPAGGGKSCQSRDFGPRNSKGRQEGANNDPRQYQSFESQLAPTFAGVPLSAVTPIAVSCSMLVPVPLPLRSALVVTMSFHTILSPMHYSSGVVAFVAPQYIFGLSRESLSLGAFPLNSRNNGSE